MKNLTLRLLTVSIVILLFGNFQCGCGEEYVAPKFNLEIPIHIQPDVETLHTGDTIWLSVTLKDKMVFDLNTDSEVLVDNALFYCSVLIEGGGKENADKDDLFEFITDNIVDTNLVITSIDGEADIKFHYGCPDILGNDYHYKFGITVNYPGAYFLKINYSNGGASEFKSSDCDSLVNNTLAPFASVMYKFAVDDPHLDIYYHCVPEYSNLQGDEQETIEKYRYWFKVE